MTARPRPRRSAPTLAPVLLALSAVLAAVGCRGASKAAPATTSSTEPQVTTTVESTTTTTTTPPPAVYPLSGRPVTDEGKAARPAVSVKIDNVVEARPQAGIAAADVVYEQFTEGVTRFVVVHHSGDADAVGPVRSVRPADAVLVTPLGGVLGFSGGSPGAVALAAESPLTLVTETDTAVMYRRPDRVAPHNLYTSTQGLLSRAAAGTGAPPKLAEFLREGQTFGGPGATPTSSIQLVPASYVTSAYDWDGASGTWLRTTDGRPHLLEEGRIAPTTVILQFTPYVYFIDDYSVTYPEVTGSGDAWVFANGSMVQGTWSKSSPGAVTTFTDASGAPIALPPGQTWIHLISPGSSISTG